MPLVGLREQREAVEVRLKTRKCGAVFLASFERITKKFAGAADLEQSPAPAHVGERKVEKLKCAICRGFKTLFLLSLCPARARDTSLPMLPSCSARLILCQRPAASSAC